MDPDPKDVVGPYSETIKQILDASHSRVLMIDSLLSTFHIFLDSTHELMQMNGNFLKTESEFHSDDAFRQSAHEWISNSVALPEDFQAYIDGLENGVIQKLHSLRDEFNSKVFGFDKVLSMSQTDLQEAQNNYVKGYKVYIDHCQKMEALSTKVMADNCPDSQTLQLKLDEMRRVCPQIEADALHASEVLGSRKREFARSMEGIIIDYERTERHFYQEVQSIVTRLTETLDKVISTFQTRNSNATNQLEKIISEMEPLIQGMDVIYEPHLPELEFTPPIENPFEFVSWKTVFAADLNAKFMQAKKDIIEPGIDIHEGDIFEVFDEKSRDGIEMQNERDGRRYILPRINFAKSKYKRPVFQLSEPFNGLTTSMFVLGLQEIGSDYRCRTAGGEIVVIPTKILQRVNK